MEPDKRFEFWRKAEEEATEPKNKEEIREAWMLDCHSSFIAEMFANEIDAAEGENREPVASNEDNACDQGEANNDEDSSEELAIIQAMTIAATPANKRLMKWYERGGKLGSQAACLIRDTMKVAGMKDSHAVPIAALFYVDPKEPEAGGTGHTIRVCRNANIPVIFQDHWTKWLMELNDF